MVELIKAIQESDNQTKGLAPVLDRLTVLAALLTALNTKFLANAEIELALIHNPMAAVH